MNKNDIKDISLVFVSLVLSAGMIAITPHDRSKLPGYNKDTTTSMGDDDLDSANTLANNNYQQNVEVFQPTLSGTVFESSDVITTSNINPYDLFINNINTNFSYNANTKTLNKLVKSLDPKSEAYTSASKIILDKILSDAAYNVKNNKNFIYAKDQNSDIAIALNTSINHEGITIYNAYNSIAYYNFIHNSSLNRYILNLFNENVRLEYKPSMGVLTIFGNRLSEEFTIPYDKQPLVEQQLFLDYKNQATLNDIISHMALILSYDVDEAQKLVLK